MKKYDNYKDSGIEWIGEIPNHWNVKRLKNIGSLYSGLSGKSGADFKSEPDMNTKPFINFTNVANNKYIVSDNFGFVTLNEDEKQNRVLKGDLLFLMSSENQEEVGKSSLLNNDFDELYLNSFCKGLRIKNDNIYPNFLNYLLNSSVLSQLVSLEGRGFTRINLRMEGIQNLPIVFPKFDEQTQIANYLDHKTDHTDLLIAKKEQFISLLQEERTAIINQAVTKGLDPKVQLKDSGIEWLGEIPAHWEIKKLKFIKSNKKNAFVDGPFGSNLKTEHFVENGDVYVIDSGLITSGVFHKKREMKTITNDHFQTVLRSESKQNDIIIAKIGANFGMSGILPKLDKPSLVSGNTLKLTVNEEMYDLKLIHLQLLNLKTSGEIDLLVKGSAQPALSMGVMSDLPFVIPSTLEEQVKIRNYILNQHQRIDELISKSKQEIELLKEYKTAFISDVITGKVDVRE